MFMPVEAPVSQSSEAPLDGGVKSQLSPKLLQSRLSNLESKLKLFEAELLTLQKPWTSYIPEREGALQSLIVGI